MNDTGGEPTRALKIAIQPDLAPLASGRQQSFSDHWFQLAADSGHEAVRVDVREPDLMDTLRQCDAFMWYFWNAPSECESGKRLVAALNHTQLLPTFPSWQTCWTFEDKHAQAHLLAAAGVPIPATRVFWNRHRALEYLDTAQYPLVVKLAGGIGGTNVALVQGEKEARYLVDRLFGDGMTHLPEGLPGFTAGGLQHRLLNTARAAMGKRPLDHYGPAPIQRGCILLQQFLPGNSYDIRALVIGGVAYAHRRFNREGDFRASGSGKRDCDPASIDPAAIMRAFEVAQALAVQVVSMDLLQHHGQWVVGEVSFYYEAWVMHESPGYWRREHRKADPQLHLGHLHPADVIYENFTGGLPVAAPV